MTLAQPVAACSGATAIAPPAITRWAVAVSHPQAEQWADANLRRQGYDTYLPLYAVQRRDRALPSLRHTVLAPLFSRYLFVRHVAGESWRPIYETPGVARLLRDGDKLSYAAEGAVSALQASEASRRTLTPPGPLWRPGMPCRLVLGAFVGHDAVVVSVQRSTAVVVLPVFGQVREAIVGLPCLAPRDVS